MKYARTIFLSVGYIKSAVLRVVPFTALLLTLAYAGNAISVEPSSVNAPLSCIQLAYNDTKDKSQHIKKRKPANPKVIAPLKSNEVNSFLAAMTPSKSANEESWGIGAVTKGSNISLERLGIILDDASILLIILHTQQAISRLENAPEKYRSSTSKLKNSLNEITQCARNRFYGRGGNSAYENTLKIVSNNKKKFEKIVFHQMMFGRLQDNSPK